MTTIYLDETSRALCDGRVARITTTAESPPVAKRSENQVVRQRARLAAFIVPRFIESFGPHRAKVADCTLRDLPALAVAKLLGVEERTLRRWHGDARMFAAALAQRPIEFLERLACFVAPQPAPALPAAMRVRRNVGLAPRLELRGPFTVLAALEPWAAQFNVRCWRNSTRMTLEGDMGGLQRARAKLMALERWLTLTPTPADIAAWIGGA
jgi:hypothetical protein